MAVLVARKTEPCASKATAVGYAIVHELDEVFMVFTVLAQHPHTDGVGLLLASLQIIAENNLHSKVKNELLCTIHFIFVKAFPCLTNKLSRFISNPECASAILALVRNAALYGAPATWVQDQEAF